MNFEKNINEVKALYDVSLVHISSETPEKEAFKSIKNSFFGNLVVSLSKLIMFTNLILIGHSFIGSKQNYDLFMIYQTNVVVLEILGKFVIVGILKKLFEEKEDMEELYNLYIKIKTVLVFLIPLITIPFCICSYFIIGLLFKYTLKIDVQDLNHKIFFQFLIFTPIIYLFELLYILNIQFLYYLNKTKTVFIYISFFLICHITFSYLLLYILNLDLYGLSISYFANTFLFYFFSNIFIRKLCEETNDNFFLISNKENYSSEIVEILKEKISKSLLNIEEILFMYFCFFVAFFTDKNQLIINIIYLDFFALIKAINIGFYFSLKRHISTKIEESEYRQKYVATFGFYYIIICLALFLVLIIFKDFLLNIYLKKGGSDELKNICSQLRIYFPLSVLLSSFRMLLNGIVRGMNIPFLSLPKKIIYSIFAFIICLVFCFYENNGISGLWKTILIMSLLLIIDTTQRAIQFLRAFFHNIIRL